MTVLNRMRQEVLFCHRRSINRVKCQFWLGSQWTDGLNFAGLAVCDGVSIITHSGDRLAGLHGARPVSCPKQVLPHFAIIYKRKLGKMGSCD